MGCTSSKENSNPPSTTITDQNEQLINEQFRKWLKINRPKADQYVLDEIIASAKPSTNLDDYRAIVGKALDLLSDRSDIKTIQKLNKLVQKEVSLASPNKVAHTIDVLKQTAEKLRQGQIHFDNTQSPPTTNVTTDGEQPKTSDNHGISSGEPGKALKEALEKARILFYKGKQAAIFANPNGGYDVRIIDDNDDALQQDGNLLRSIIVTEVKMRPKPIPIISTQSTVPPPPPPSTKLLDEREIGDDFRRSIDAALKGLEAIYQTSPVTSSENANISQTDGELKFADDINGIIVETTSGNQIEDVFVSSAEAQQRIKEHLLSQSVQEKEQLNVDIHRKSLHSPDSSSHCIPPKPSRSIEEHHQTLSQSFLPPVIVPSDTNITMKSPSHNVTYTEIIQSESRDGEQSRRFITESYDDLPTKDDEQTTSLKVVTKSEFSNDPTSGEKTMEQSVQIITIKVRNETVKTTNPVVTFDSSDKQSVVHQTGNPLDAMN